MVTDNEGGIDSTVDYRASQDGPREPNSHADDQGTASRDADGPVSDQLESRDVADRGDETGAARGSAEGGDRGKRGKRGASRPRKSPREAADDGAPPDSAPPEESEAGDVSRQAEDAAATEPKGKKKGGRRRHRPSDQEVLTRLMEKNEIILQLTKKNKELEERRKALEDKRVRILAEFENYRKRTRKEWELLKEQSKAEVILEMLSIVDDFERAFSAMAGQDDEFVQGIRLIYNNMLSVLERFGVRKMTAMGQPFDPNYHMAVAHIEHDEVEANHVVEVTKEGYLMDGTVIRPAHVVIAK